MLTFATQHSHHSEFENSELLSISGTPSGVQTPRPSGTDKRLPGIHHSYFGQVGDPSFATPHSQIHSAPFKTPFEMARVQFSSALAPGSLPTAPASPNEQTESSMIQPTSEQEDRVTLHPSCAEEDVLNKYPTPPTSSRTSSTSGPIERFEKNDGVSPRASDVFNVSRPSLTRLKSGNAVMKLRARGQTHCAVANPAHIAVTDSVPVAHLSNPTTSAHSRKSSTCTSDPTSQSALSSLSSNLELVKLTNGMNGPGMKATPPITPRTLSNDGSEGARTTTSPPERSTGRTEIDGTSTPRSGGAVPLPKGELVVTISAARGLRPSFDPYAVCVFEWIESIAHHHKQEALLPGPGSRAGDIATGGLPMSRNGSGMGRSMAITMKSRQGSTTSLSDQREFKSTTQVTDPQWDHEAVLYVPPALSSSRLPNEFLAMSLAIALMLMSIFMIAQIKKPSWAMSRLPLMFSMVHPRRRVGIGLRPVIRKRIK